MIKRFCKGKPYTLLLICESQGLHTWSENAVFSEKLPDGTLKFCGTGVCYLLHKDKSAEITEYDQTQKCGWTNIVAGWSF